MNETNPSHPTQIEEKLQELYDSVSPDPDFARRLHSQILDRASQPQPFSRLDLFLRSLAWVSSVLLLILALVWVINNLIPQPAPGTGYGVETTSRVSSTQANAQTPLQKSTGKSNATTPSELESPSLLPGTPVPSKDLFLSTITFKRVNATVPSNPNSFIADLYADGDLLGRVDFGRWLGGFCDRSWNGGIIAFLYDKYDPSRNANPTLRWINLEDVTQIYEPLPDFSLQSPTSFAPQDFRLAFEACPSDGKCGLYIFDLSTGEVRRISGENTWFAPVWSPDGTHLAIQLPPDEEQGRLNAVRVLRSEDGTVLYTGRADAPDSPLRNWGEAPSFEVQGMERCEGTTPTPP